MSWPAPRGGQTRRVPALPETDGVHLKDVLKQALSRNKAVEKQTLWKQKREEDEGGKNKLTLKSRDGVVRTVTILSKDAKVTKNKANCFEEERRKNEEAKEDALLERYCDGRDPTWRPDLFFSETLGEDGLPWPTRPSDFMSDPNMVSRVVMAYEASKKKAKKKKQKKLRKKVKDEKDKGRNKGRDKDTHAAKKRKKDRKDKKAKKDKKSKGKKNKRQKKRKLSDSESSSSDDRSEQAKRPQLRRRVDNAGGHNAQESREHETESDDAGSAEGCTRTASPALASSPAPAATPVSSSSSTNGASADAEESDASQE